MRLQTATCVIVAALAAGLWGASSASAQTTTEVKYPDDNVSGGEVALRRPGLWVSTGLGKVLERQSAILYNHDGASPQPKEPVDVRTQLLVATLEGLFDTLQNLFSASNLLGALTGTTTATTTTGS